VQSTEREENGSDMNMELIVVSVSGDKNKVYETVNARHARTEYSEDKLKMMMELGVPVAGVKLERNKLMPCKGVEIISNEEEFKGAIKMMHEFKSGYKVGDPKRASLVYQLTVLTEENDSRGAYRLAEAVDREYKKLFAEQYGEDKEEVFGQWQKDKPLG